MNKKQIISLEKRIGYSFKDKNLKSQALTHRSHANENKNTKHNERLEFLGDAVFDLCVSDLLMAEHPTANEGVLSKMRAALVNTTDLSQIALEINLDQDIKLGISEKRENIQSNPRLLASTLEALIGAIYLDSSYLRARQIIKKILGDKIKSIPISRDYKSILQEFTQKNFQKVPTYNLASTHGQPHSKLFDMEVYLNKKLLGKGSGKNKKEAAQAAAFAALKNLGIPPYSQM